MKIRLYPNKKQEELIQQTFGCTRYIYNQGLAFRQEQYINGNPIGYNETNRLLYKLKHDGEHDWLNSVDAHPLQQCLRDLDNAFKNFFEKRTGYPNYKTKHDHYKSYRTQYVNNNITVFDGHVKLSKLGRVKARITKELPKDAKIHNATVEQMPDGKYYAVLSVETDVTVQKNAGGMTGIDAGLKDFYVTSGGKKVSNPGFTTKTEKKLKRAQHKLTRKAKGSKNREKQRVCVAKINAHLAAQRKDFLHKEALKLVKENQIICIEDLNVKGMAKNHHLAKSITDASWAEFFRMLIYKAPKYGCKVIKVPRFYASSQICSDCGFQYSGIKDLSVRKWICPKCGSIHDRDVNAAVNILHKGLEMRKQPQTV